MFLTFSQGTDCRSLSLLTSSPNICNSKYVAYLLLAFRLRKRHTPLEIEEHSFLILLFFRTLSLCNTSRWKSTMESNYGHFYFILLKKSLKKGLQTEVNKSNEIRWMLKLYPFCSSPCRNFTKISRIVKDKYKDLISPLWSWQSTRFSTINFI